jgi:hypothetical protein
MQMLREMTCNVILNFKGFVSVHGLNYLAFNDLHAHTLTHTHTHTHEYMHEFVCITKDIILE